MKISKILKSERNINLNKDLLIDYYKGALKNSSDLMKESKSLIERNFHARSYFLSCTSIEECGKAFEAFLGIGRNLKDPAVQKALIKNFEDHNKKKHIWPFCFTFGTSIFN